MNKQDHINRLMEMQKLLKSKSEVPVVEPVVVEVKEESEEEINTLPTKYLSLNQLKLSAKEVAQTTGYLDRVKQTEDKYETVQITEEKANKIRRELVRLTTGVTAVVPLKCKGSQCAFASTCVTGDTEVLGSKTKKIKDIEIGDMVYSFNIQTQRLEKDTVTDKKVIESKRVFLITTWYGNKIKCTEDHQILTVNKSLEKFTWKSIETGLKKGSRLLIADVDDIDEDLESVGDVFVDKILDIKELKTQDVYDITVKKNSNFIANNIVVHNCPFYQQDVAPVGLPCPVEQQLLEYWMEKYKAEFNVDENSLTDLHAIGRLCTFDIYEMRLTRYLSEHDQTLLVDFISSYDEEGNAISNKATSAAWDTIDKISRGRSKELKELMATREAKAKIIETVNQVHKNSSINALKDKFEDLIKRQSKVIDGESKEL